MADPVPIKEQDLIPAPPDVFAKEWSSLQNKYDFVEEAGRGRTGVAYHIRDRNNQLSFCLKTVLPEIATKPEIERIRDTLRKECEILAPLSHRCLPQIFGYDFEATRPYYICSFHPGITLQKFIKSQNKLKRDEAIFVTTSLISVLEYLHQKGRTHNDLHLQNVLISQFVLKDGIMLIDFGSGHRESDSSENTEARGNVHFMPNRLKGLRERLVNRKELSSEFRVSDFTAFGHLLASSQDAFFYEMSVAQNAALNAFCTRLISGEFASWQVVKDRFGSVLEPFQHFDSLQNSFIDEHGFHVGIPIPIYGRVPVGPEWLAAVNSQRFQALRGINQLSFCDWYFPGARHSRFEHSLGVFNLMRLALEHLSVYSEVRDLYDEHDLKGALFAALMHDVGHYPFAHVLEQYAASRFAEDDEVLAEASHSLHSRSIIESQNFCETIFGTTNAGKIRDAAIATLCGTNGVLADLLDGPVDIDKMDYLRRDSHHCGVRFGEGLDPQRLLSAIRLATNGTLAVAANGVNAFEGFLILQNQMLGEVYWHEYTRSIISMFHVAVAYIVKRDRNSFISLIKSIKECKTEVEALTKILFPRLEAVAKLERKETLQGLLKMHIQQDFKSIYHCIKKYMRTDRPRGRQRVSVYASLVNGGSNLTSSRLPIDWKNARLLRRAFLDAIKELRISAEDYDVIVDLPMGKTKQRTVDVLLDNGDPVPITSLSHIQPTLFTEPAIFVSPVRVFVSPRIFDKVAGLLERVVLAAEDKFFSAETEKAEQDSVMG